MHFAKNLLKVVFAAQFLVAPLVAGAAPSSQYTITTTATYADKSPEKQAVVAWLQQHAQYVNGHLIGEFDKLQDVTVTYTRTTDGRVRPQSPGDAPPNPLPPGQPGDTYSVSNCTGGVSQSWSYKFVSGSNGGTWVLVDYKYSKKACGSDGA
ncbi:hypothetical protein NB717_001427 [Xanthomonas sacchari]|uniref:hypothetical protein n=1 Tax=Xanthomonas sacchari TaxID=56458 RepID=UPI00225DEA43|nr:hypothetical protein [Xanthomonas sacchari]MCW0460359.1 hypothetical protein [Xanthomonas sacchari]UYK77962.1 hypothetical protein NG825_06550 [Xanthomonas sacchari]